MQIWALFGTVKLNLCSSEISHEPASLKLLKISNLFVWMDGWLVNLVGWLVGLVIGWLGSWLVGLLVGQVSDWQG